MTTIANDDLSIAARSLSDSDLDAAYIASANNPQTQVIYALEINDRLTSVRSFITGIFGVNRFPLYNAQPFNFHQVDAAQTAIQDSAKNVATDLKWLTGGFAVVIVLALVAYILFKVKK